MVYLAVLECFEDCVVNESRMRLQVDVFQHVDTAKQEGGRIGHVFTGT